MELFFRAVEKNKALSQTKFEEREKRRCMRCIRKKPILFMIVLCLLVASAYYGMHQRAYMWDAKAGREVPTISSLMAAGFAYDSKPEGVSGTSSKCDFLQATDRLARMNLLLLGYFVMLMVSVHCSEPDYYRSHLMCRNARFYSTSTILYYMSRKDGKK